MAKIIIPTKEPERWLSIKFNLGLYGYSITRLAKESGVSETSMGSTKRTWLFKNQKAIAEKLGLTPQEIWPERYGDDGRPKYHSPWYPRKSITNNSKRQRLTSKAI
jgi:Ner family transcriptional regulator